MHLIPPGEVRLPNGEKSKVAEFYMSETVVTFVGIETGCTTDFRYRIESKHHVSTMSPESGEPRKFWIADVPWTMYFYGGYAIHGTYWHNNFGTPMSHGCVNMRTSEAKWLFNWAPRGTLVVVHR